MPLDVPGCTRATMIIAVSVLKVRVQIPIHRGIYKYIIIHPQKMDYIIFYICLLYSMF